MKINKLLGALMASVIALSAVSVIPAEYNDFVISASAYTKNEILVIPKEVDHISKEMYSGTRYKKLIVEGDLKYIGEEAFSGCRELEEIEFNGNISSNGSGGIDEYAFDGCFNLKKVTFKKKDAKVDKIGDYAFYFCPRLETINIPTNTASIDTGAFLNCARLSDVTIPEKTTLGNKCFGFVYYTDDQIYQRADGKTVITSYYVDDNDKEVYDTYTARAITLKVVANSPAEKYAKENKIAFKKYTTGSSASAKTKLTAPKNFKASSVTENSITLSWKPVEGAVKYNIYMFNPEKGSYTLYKTTSKTKLTVSKLESGTKYKFMVAAVSEVDGKIKKGTNSKALSVKTL